MESSNPPMQKAEDSGPSETPRTLDNITLTVLSPNTNEIPAGRVVFSDISLSTTLAQLKERLCQKVSSCPQPDRQRLIYRGKPLLDGSATLREVFAAELSNSQTLSAFSVHLVLPPPITPSSHQPPRSSSAPPIQPQTLPASSRDSTGQAAAQAGSQTGATENAPSMANLQAQQMLASEFMRNQLELFQRMLPQNSQVPQSAGGFLPPGHQIPGHTHGPHAPAPFPLQQHPQFPQSFPQHFNNHFNVQGQPGSNPAVFNPASRGFSPNPTAPNVQFPQRPDSLHSATRSTSGPGRPSDRTEGISNNPQRTISSEPAPPPPLPPTSESFGQPPPGRGPYPQGNPIPTHTSIQETVGPNGERTRTFISNQTFNIQMQTRTSTPPHLQRPGNVPQQNMSRSSTPHRTMDTFSNGNPNISSQNRPSQSFSNPTINVPPPSGLPPPPVFPTFPTINPGLPMPLIGAQSGVPPSTNSATTTAWLLNGPSGPQGFLFSPEHGYFSSTPNGNAASARAAAMRPFMHSRRIRPQPQTQNQPQDHAQGQAQNQQPGNQIRIEGINPAVRAPLVQPPNGQQQQAERNLLNFARDRAWLFIRLYFLTMIFSGYGTWLRWLLLLLTVVWCVLPETTFFQDQGRRIQRHLEDLLPLAPQPRARNDQRDQQPRQNEGAATAATENAGAPQRSGSGQRPRTPTPGEVAERIRRDHRARQATWIGDTLTRVERAVALFLASLIPGIGERHIRARNQMAEAEMRAAEDERRTADQPQAQDGTGENGAEEGQASGGQTEARGQEENHADRATSQSGGEATAVSSAVEGQIDRTNAEGEEPRHGSHETNVVVNA